MFSRSFSRGVYFSTLTAGICLCWGSSASAQSLFGGASTTMSNRSTVSSTGLSSSAPSGSGLLTGAGLTSAAGGTGAAGGTTGLNTSGLGTSTTALAGPQLNTQLGALSATIGQGGFVGGSDTTGRFVGSANAGTQSIQSTSMGGRGQTGQFGGRTTSTNQQSNFNQQYGSQSRRTIRPQQKIAFNYPQRAVTVVQTRLSTHFQKLPTNRPQLQGVQIQMGANREVTLSGRVGSLDDKKLAAIMARMEPGVRTVKNELTVSGN